MKISVIVPVYNSEKTLEKCLDSIIEQTYSNLEIIIINDGSKDSSDKIIKEYEKKDSRIIYLNNSNHGVSYSRNCGIKIANGDYITFVDSDDYLADDCYEELVKILNMKKYDFLRYNLFVVGGKGFNNELYELSNKEFDCDDYNKISRHFFLNDEMIPCLVMLLLVKSEIAKEISFNDNLTMMEDVDFYLQLFIKSKTCYFANHKKYYYYVNPDSVSHNEYYFKKNIYGVLDTNKSLKKRINDSGFNINLNMLNANHLRIISNYLDMEYRENRKKYISIIKELIHNQIFCEILFDYKLTSLKNKIYFFFVKNNLYLLQCVWLSMVKFTKKMIGKE